MTRLVVAFLLAFPVLAWAETADEAAVRAAHEAFVKAAKAGDAAALNKLLADNLQYSHSSAKLENKQEAISFAALRCATDLFPERAESFNAVMIGLGYDPANTSVDTATPAGIGNTVAAAVLAFRHNDGANQLGDLHPPDPQRRGRGDGEPVPRDRGDLPQGHPRLRHLPQGRRAGDAGGHPAVDPRLRRLALNIHVSKAWEADLTKRSRND